MSSTLSSPITALQVGTCFVGQYYHVLQQQPEYVHQFYTDRSIMHRLDRDKQETATGMMEIHNCVMSLNYTGCVIEIKSADAQDSLNGGVLVMVTGSIERKDRDIKNNFVQTFFLAPQEKGYFVLNDIFRFSEDDSYIEKQADLVINGGDHESHLNSGSPLPEPVLEPSSPAAAEMKREFTAASPDEIETIAEDYEISDQHEIPIIEDKLDENPIEVSVVTSSVVTASEVASAPAPVEEPLGEAPKHTYASILRVAKGPSATTQSYQTPSNKVAAVVSERQPAPQPTQQEAHQWPLGSTVIDDVHPNGSDDIVGSENEGDVRSIYVRNLSSIVTSSELETEFRKFGKISSGGVSVVNRKDTGVCYAFIDFEDSSSVQNATAASPMSFGNRQIYIEEKRSSSSSSRGRRGGRGRGFQNEGVRGRGGYGTRGYGRGGGQEFGREYSSRGRGGSGSRGSFGSASAGSFSRQPRRVGGNQIFQNGADRTT